MKTNESVRNDQQPKPFIDLRPGTDHEETINLIICTRDYLVKHGIFIEKATLIATDAVIRCTLTGIDYLHGSGLETEKVFALAADLTVQDAKHNTAVENGTLGTLSRILMAGLNSTSEWNKATALQ